MRESSSENPSRTNPFCVVSAFNLPLKAETCQQIHAAALHSAVRNPQVYVVPPGVPVDSLRMRVLRYGPQVYLEHPTEIEHLFRGVTLSVYQAIESLYCSRLGRSYVMIYRILRAMAIEAGVTPIEEEAVWAICMHLEELRAVRAAVSVERSSSTWWLTRLTSTHAAESDCMSASSREQPFAALIIDVDAPQVLAFRADERGVEAELRSLAVYDAIVSERRPHPRGAGGLVWRMPSRLIVEETPPEDCQRGCRALGVPIERATHTSPLVEELRQHWASERARRKIAPGRWTLAFESLLNRVFGTSPQRTREELDRSLGQLVGFSQDPAELFPALRAFLPARPACIGQDGAVVFDGLHYADRALSYLPGSPVIVRRSEQTEAVLWVYLEGEVLCQAKARELARRDGSYRTTRARR